MKIVSIAPSRISLFGGGTDVDPYAREYGGLCLNMAINIRHRVEINDTKVCNLTPFDNKAFFDCIVPKDLGITHFYDNTIESGLGSSAGLAVALLGGIYRYRGWTIDPAKIAEQAWDIEVNQLKLFGGKQDQYACAYGGVNVMEFGKEVKVTPLSRDFIAPLLPHLVLFHSGIRRTNPKVQEGLKELTNEQIESLDYLKSLVTESIEPIAQGNIQKVADLMYEAWLHKKSSNKGMSNEQIDSLYEAGLEAGALAGKLLGSGGGGHLLFIVDKDKELFIKKMEAKGLKWIDFSIDWTGLDTRITE